MPASRSNALAITINIGCDLAQADIGHWNMCATRFKDTHRVLYADCGGDERERRGESRAKCEHARHGGVYMMCVLVCTLASVIVR